jgi:hypothetical protein
MTIALNCNFVSAIIARHLTIVAFVAQKQMVTALIALLCV